MTHVSKQRLLFATRNEAKVREVREILGIRFHVEDLSVCPEMPEVEETGVTFEENVLLKIREGVRHYAGWVLADDSGLEVDALDGAPGVRSARFAGEKATMADNRALLLEQMRGVPMEKRTARFRCVVALASRKERSRLFCGIVEGRIATDEKGERGFGYDSLFIPAGDERTFAEMTSDEKHALSHRGRALLELADFFANV